MTIAAHVPNIFDRSRFDSDSNSETVVFVDDGAAAVAAGADLVLVDLDRCEDPSLFVVDGLRAIGFGSHVHEHRLEAAANAGFSETLARSVFFRRLPGLLKRADS